MTKIYEQFDAAFANVSAFAILDGTGAYVAKVAIKFPKDGAGRLYAYTHIFGSEMTRGFAGGYGYDKRSPAVADGFAAAKATADNAENLKAIQAALSANDGHYWDSRLRDAGFVILGVV